MVGRVNSYYLYLEKGEGCSALVFNKKSNKNQSSSKRGAFFYGIEVNKMSAEKFSERTIIVRSDDMSDLGRMDVTGVISNPRTELDQYRV